MPGGGKTPASVSSRGSVSEDVVRTAEPRDLEAIVAIYNYAVRETTATFDTEPVMVADRGDWFAQFGREHPLLVADTGGSVAGFAYYLPYRTRPAYRTSKESTVYVEPERHRQGIASALYTELFARARANGVHAMIAVLGGDNPASAALHLKFGFRLVGRLEEVGRKFDRWVDTQYFQLLL
jgi:L-amino acid N-acyltransferase